MGIIPIATYEACFALGDYLYAVDIATGLFWIWDISDPEGPVNPPAYTPLNLGAGLLDIKLYQSVAYVISSDQIFTVDIDDPSNPVLTNTTTATDETLTCLQVVGDEIYVGGTHIGHIGTGINPDDPNEFATEDEPTNPQADLAIQGRRLYEVEQTTGFLRSYRIGGFYCGNIATGSLQADEIFAELIRARHLWLKGEIVATSMTAIGGSGEADTGVVTAANYMKIGTKFIFWSDDEPDPNTLFFATLSSLFLASDGSVWRNTDGVSAWVAM